MTSRGLKTVLIGGITLISLGGTPAPTRKPSRFVGNPVQLQVVYGDKISMFQMTKAPGGGTLEFTSSGERPRRRSMSAKDWTTLSRKLAKIEGPSNDPSLCPRATITLTYGKRRTMGCLLAPNLVAKKLRELANLLEFYL